MNFLKFRNSFTGLLDVTFQKTSVRMFRNMKTPNRLQGTLCSWVRASWINVKMFQKDSTFYSILFRANSSTCFVWYFHPSSGARTPFRLLHDNGRSHTVCHYQMLQVQFIRAPDDGWKYHTKHVELFAGNKIMSKVVACWNILTINYRDFVGYFRLTQFCG
jgi:hypothetical protein